MKINLPDCHPNNATCRHDLRTRDPKLRRWCCQGPPPGVVAPQMEFIRCQRGSRVKRVGPRNPSSPSDVSETRVKYKHQKEQWIKSHLYFCSAAFVTQGPSNSCDSIGLETEDGTIKKTVAGSLSQVHHVCHIAVNWRNSETITAITWLITLRACADSHLRRSSQSGRGEDHLSDFQLSRTNL